MLNITIKNVRYYVVFLQFLGMLVLGYLRTNLSIAIVDMTKSENITIGNTTYAQAPEFEWSSVQKGFILSLFSYGVLLSPIGGYLASKYGGSSLFGLTTLLTALFTMMTPVLARQNFTLFLITRILEGICEGFAMSCIAAILSTWILPNERARLGTYVLLGSTVGFSMNYPITGYLSQKYGWGTAFYVSGVSGMVFYVIWRFFVTNSPLSHKYISEEEKNILNEANKCEINDRRRSELSVPWKKILTSRVVLLIILQKLLKQTSSAFFSYSIPLYIDGIYNVDTETVGLLAAIPCMGHFLEPLSGWFFDYVRSKKLFTITTLYKIFMVTSQVGQSILSLLICWNHKNAVFLMTLHRGIQTLETFTLWLMPIDIAPRYSSIIMGLCLMTTNIGNLLSPILMGYLVPNFETVELWNHYFTALALITFCAAMLILFVNCEEAEWNNYKSSSRRSIN